MRRLSLNARQTIDDEGSDGLFVVLLEITHPELAGGPIRLSTDNAERISTDPLVYGTRSTWRGANPVTQPFLWIIASALLPSDQEDAPAAAQIAVENLSSEMAALLRSFRTPATVNLAVVLAETPDLIEAEYLDLQLLSANITESEILLSISRDEIELEPFPPGRMTRNRFPGLHL
ncbi:hypothetical protein EGN72_02425 [Pseudorhodobacter sp. E13]|uniref:hypothetical protein n=1 Tax=Pseudorhodobacter sp. E13 TaxID=2487931 RepID=UPI000F8ED8EC|nr:hypothetical protein [Pseudorhodobacter sp. E13]RUS64866.1 hypothetical protein EGN72_02425 [Pseudorhodobacter sp. E13]